jgi:hypothetical protein
VTRSAGVASIQVVIALIAPHLLASAASCRGTEKDRDRGEAMFFGEQPLKGTIREHQGMLPPEVVKCTNCHTAGKQPGAEAGVAPRIDRSLLLVERQRRGGPPSSYGAESFCRLLRTGIDPAHILIAREMPVYAVDDAQCAGLWRFLTEQ